MSRTNIENIYPLSPMQQGMLFDTLYASESGMYFVQIAWTLRGGLDAPAFLRAWQEVVDRHAILRTGFAWERLERPMQIVRKKVTLPVHEQDLRALSPEEQGRAIEAYAAADRERGFELSKAPLMRVALFRLSDDTYRFLWGRHHLLLDGWSTPLLVKEVFTLYQAFSRGEDARLERPRPYGEYIGWIGKQDPARVESFWRARLEGFSAPTPFRVDRPASGEPRHEDQKLTLSEELSNRLQAFARQHQLTQSTLVQGAWAILLSRYSGEPDVLFGATVSGRSAPVAGIDRMVGMFINTLPVRVQLAPDEPALAWLERLQKHQLELRDYEHSALVELQGYTGVPRGTPLFESLVVFENYPVEEALRQGAGGLVVADSRTVEKSNVPLTLLAVFRRALTLHLSYDARRFDADTIERALGHLGVLLEGLIAEPARSLGDLALLTAAEEHRLLVAWNDSAAAYANADALHELFEAQARKTPSAVAVVFEGKTLSYRQLDEDANRVANLLQRFDVGPDVLVGVCMDRSLELVVAILGVSKAGGAYVPLDPSYPEDRLGFMIADARAPVLLTQARLRGALPDTGARVIALDAEPALAEESAARPSRGPKPEDLAYVIYTSGSTGRPKGVMIPHRAIMNRVLWLCATWPFGPEDAVLQKTPISFDASVWEFFAPLISGSRVVMARPEGHRDGGYLVQAIIDNHVTVLQLVPSMLELLVLEPELHRCTTLKRLYCGGEALSRSLVARFRAEVDAEVINTYGPTEAAIDSTYHVVERDGGDGAPMSPIGRPIGNARIYILDERLHPVPAGVPAELHVGGVGLARGYVNRPDLTAEKFIQSPFEGEGSRLYKTGDLTRYLADGTIEYLGRIDHQVKLRGFRIELGEIEAVLRQHAGVRETVVVVREDVAGDKRLVAYVVPGVEAPSATDLRAFSKDRLPEYMVPSAYVTLPALPLMANGKVDRRALPAPDAGATPERTYVAPRGPVEEAIASIFAEVLKLSAGEVGAHDGFFELGGHSLLATQAVSRLRAALGADLPLRAIFESPTPAELAACVSEALGAPPLAAVPPLVRVPRQGHVALSFGQERLWFLSQLDPSDTSYNIPFAVRMAGPLDAAALRRAVEEVVRRHEVLRTTFASVDGKPAGVVHEVVEIPLPVADLTAVPAEGRDAAIREATAVETRTLFDLARGPLIRTRLLELAVDDHVLLLTLHHIVSDVWTRAVLNREISAIYQAFQRGQPSPLPELAVQYADYAAWQRSWLSGDVLEAQLTYWKNQLGSAPRLLQLPTDRPRPAVRGSRGARRAVALSPELTKGLRELARREGVTLYMLLLAALDVLLYRYTGQSDIVVGSPIAGRTRAETEGLIGFFLNTLVLRVELADDLTFKDLLQRVRAVSLGAYAHQDMPFERLVQELDHERDLSRSPLFQVIFNLQNVPMETMALSGVGMKGIQIESTTTKYDLTLILVEGPRTVAGSLAYSTDLFDASTIERMVTHLQVLLEGVVKGADKRLRELPMLPESERAQLLVGWNDTAAELPAEETVVDLFEAQVDRTPDALALVAGAERLSFRELDARANRLAHHLERLGVGPDVVVGLCLERSAELIVGLLGILKAGGAYVPLDPAYPAHRLAQILGEARSPVLVTRAALAASLPAQGAALVRLDADGELIAAESDARPESDLAEKNLVYVLFTSGSTGKPKGVAIEHRNLVNYVRGVSARLDLPPGSSYAHVSTFSADLGNTVLFPPLCLGGTLHVLAQELTTDPAGLAAYFVREGIDCLKIVPSHLAALLSAPQPSQVLPRKLLVLGGEATSWELVDRLEKLAPDCRIMNHYGPTETTVGVLTYPLQMGARPAAPILPLGRPLPNARVYVLDPAMAPAPMGVPGEVYIGGAGVARGYLGQPELTAERFVRDPWSNAPGARLYRTGDRARYLQDGSLLFLGRVDFQVKIRGHRIELGDIEAALVSYPAFQEAVVLADEDAAGDKRLVAYVVPVDPAPDLAAARAHLEQRLPAYMVPATFVVLAALPLTPNGKIDRKALPALSLGRAEEDDHVAPRNPIEEVLASIWSDVFALQREHLGVHERFADLGGHSLLAIQIIARARDAFQIELPLRAIFEWPTIAGLAEQVDREMREGEGLVVPPIERAPRDGFLPISFAQERLWFLNQLEPDSPFYNVPLNMRFAGTLDVPALERALREVIERHEVLRTTFTSVGGKAVQRIHPGVELRLAVEDLSALPPEGREAALRRASGAEVQLSFDLARGPLIRARLLRLAAEDHALLMTSHHIVSDGWTRGILNREVMALYQAFSRGEPSPLAPLPIQYADYAAWQRKWLDGDVYDRQMGYWKEKLGGAPPELLLPTDRPRPPAQTYRGAWRALALPAELARSLKELSRAEGTTFFMTLLAAFDVLLHRLTGQDDVVLGTPVAGRTKAETEGLIGFFINTLVLRTTLSEELTFRELLQRVRETCLGAYAHQDMSFERLVQELAPERDLSRAPLFQVLFTFQNPPREGRSPSGLKVGGVRAENPTSKYDITLALSEQDRGLVAAVEYSTDLFDQSTIERMLVQYRTVLQGIVADPDARLFEIAVMLPEEERRILVDWNRTAAEFPGHRCVHELIEEQAARTPESVAVAFGDRQLTYRELDERSNKLAHHLVKVGVGPDVLVGLCVTRSLDLAVAVLGVLKAGGAYVPIDPSYPMERIAWMLEDSAVSVVLTQEKIADELPATAVMVRLDADWYAIEGESVESPGAPVAPHHLAYVIYTSGSTGKPKGVMIHHRGLVNYLWWAQSAYHVSAGRGAPVHSSVSFDLTVTGLFTPLLAGRTVVMLPEEGEIEALVRALTDEGDFSLVKLTPAHLEVLNQLVPPDKAARATGALVIGGEALSWETVAFWRKHAPRTRLINEYGPTETVVGCCVYDAAREGDFTGQVPIGRPIANTELYVLDRHLRPVPIGVRGELYIGGAGVARGYLNRPELTAERFIQSPFDGDSGARLYKTGDVARWRETADLEFLGRADDQVKIRGYRIELGEIEAVLAQHPGLTETAILARESVDVGGPGDRRLVAYYVAGEEPAPEQAALRSFLAARLPEYMVPTAYVRLEALPLTPNGKVDRKALPAPEARGLAGELVAPRNPVEEVVAGAWAEVLDLEQVGVHDNFFELGGHSLLATQVMGRIATSLSVELPLQAIFEAPTVAGLAERVSEALARGHGLVAPPLVRVPRDGELPLSFGQERLWFLEQLAPGGTLYVIPQAVRLTGALDAGALERALHEIVRRHEVLRTTFAASDGKPRQIVHAPAEIALPVLDLEPLPPPEREQAVRREAALESGTPFDLATGPLFRPRLLRLGADDHVLLLTMHHIVSDAWTQGVLNSELVALYDAFHDGRPSPLGELAIQYADYAAWQRRWLSGEVLEQELAHWRQALAGAPGALDLPTDRPRPPVQSPRGGRKAIALPAELRQGLQALSRREGATLFMTLLAAFEILLHRYTGQDDLVVGTPIAGRARAETERLVGFFINALALRTRVSGELSFQALLARVKDTCLQAYAHQEMPFERLVHELLPERDLSRQPLFQVTFTLNNAPREALALPGLSLRGIGSDVTTAKYDLSLAMVEGESELYASLSYAVDLFDASTIDRMLGHLRNVLASVVADPAAPIGDVPMLSAEERRTLTVAWNDTAAPYPADRCAHELFEEQAARSPDAVAIVFGALRLTYREVDERANQLARHLTRYGVGPDVLVGVSLRRSPEVVVAILGAMKAGGAYVPLDPAYPAERLEFMMADARVAVLLTEEGVLADLPPPPAPVICLDTGWIDVEQESADSLGRIAGPSSAAYVIYTSGSTGRPKGVVVEHRGLGNLAAAQARAFGVTPASRVLQFASSNFDASVSEILVTLLAGATLVLAPQEALLPGPELLRTLTEHAVTVATVPPSALAVLPHEALPALRTIVVAGEACSEELVARWAPGRTFINAYGPTEASVCATMGECAPSGGRPSIGKPMANVRVYLLDARKNPVPVGVSGELYIGGAGLARGYLNRAELTGERFVASPLPEEPGARLYRTGDLCRYRPDGSIDFLGRIDHQVKVRGFRIELGEIEAALTEQEGVRDAAAMAREDAPGDVRLVAYVVLAPGAGVSVAELKQRLRERLPEYMVPGIVVELPAMPLSPNGKVDRRALPAPEAGAGEERSPGEARGPVEDALAAIFADVLRRSAVGVREGFFELGGHSLLATQVIARVREAFGVEVPLRALFEAPSPAALAVLVQSLLREGEGVAAPPIVRVGREGELPLSFGQERLWFLNQLEPGDPSYTIPLAIRMEGALDAPALRRALAEVVRRHEVLRTTFRVTHGKPSQVIHDAGELDLPSTVLTELPAGAREEALRRDLAAEAARPFDLASGPILRARLFVLAPEDHVLLLTMHHIASDGWSMGILNREIAALYRAFRASEPSPVPELPVQYADYAAWQRGWLSGDVLDAQLGYWRRALAGVPAALDLATDRPRPPVQSYRGARRVVTLPPELTFALKELSRQEGATLFMTLLAAFDVLLHRYTGQLDIAVGSLIAGRTHAETEPMIGVFINTLVLRVDLDEDPTFRELLQRVKQACLGAYAHQDMPFERLVQELAPERDRSRSPLFQVLLMLQNAPRDALSLGDLRLRGVTTEGVAAKFDLTLAMSEGPSGLVASMVYNTDLFDGPTVDRMLRHLETLLAGVAAAPGARLWELPLVSADERRSLLALAGGAASYPVSACLHELFQGRAAMTPDAVAVTFEGQSLTYGELEGRANQVAHALRRRGVGPDMLVGLCVERSLEMIVGLLGILKAGGAYLPLDPEYPKDRLAFMVEDARATVVLTQARHAGALTAGRAEILQLDADWPAISREPLDPPASGALPSHLAYVIYTSGSTGAPKGAMVEHRNVVRLFTATEAWFGFDARDVWTMFHSYAFDFSVWEIWGALLHGGRVVIVPYWVSRAPDAYYELLGREGVTVLNQTPSAFRQLIRAEEEASPKSVAALRLRYVIFGGEALDLGDLRPWWDVHGDVTPRLVNMYGITETTVHVTYRPVSRADLDRPWSSVIGEPIPDLSVHVLDAHLSPVPLGVPGEMYVGGAGVARGYQSRPELSTERFLADPFRPGGRLYRTGDLARRLGSGDIEYLGRIDHQVKLRGFRIELGEIEAALDQHAGVAEAVVLAREDTPGDKRLVAYVVEGQTAAIAGELRAFLQERLPEYMVPSAFVMLEALPLTSNGKIDRRALPAPEAEAAGTDAYVAPRGAVEEAIAGIFAEVLKVPRVGAHDDFFELGGHSLLATQAISRVRAAVGVELPLRALFDAPTPAALAVHVEAARCGDRGDGGVDVPTLAPVPRGGPHELSFAQERFWFLAQLEPDDPSYVVPLSMRLGGAVSVTALERALVELVRRHEVLRTTFTQGDAGPAAIIGDDAGVPLQVTRWEALSPAARAEALRAEIAAETRRPFDLSTGPLVRARLFELDERDHLLLLTLHHIVCDAWALEIVRRELAALYGAFASDRPSPLAALPVQYVDYAAWQRRWLDGEVLARELAYWKERLQGAPAALDLPTDHPRPPVMSHRGELRAFTLPPALATGLGELSRREGVTLFMTLLAAFEVLLHRYTGQTDLVVGTPIVGRTRAETEGLVGLFLNTLVLRTELTSDLTFRELLARVGEVCLGAYAHQDMPFERLVQELQPERDLSRSPVFQVMFTLHNAPREPERRSGLTLRRDEVETGTSKFDLSLALGEGPGGLGGTFEYATDLFDRATIERMVGHFGALLEGVVAAPDARLRELEILPAEERRRLVAGWNDTRADYARGAGVHQLVAARAALSPEGVAVSFEGRSAVTYGELDRRANRLARYLRARGVGPDVRVGLAVERSVAMVVGLLGILKAGGAYVPLDPTYPKERLAFMATDSGLRVLVTEEALVGLVPEPAGGSVRLDADAAAIAGESDAPLDGAFDAGSLAYVIYTSGSTGKPKGVQIPHRAVVNFLASMAREPGLAASDRLLAVTSLSFDIAGLELWLPLSAGAYVEIAGRETAADGAALARRLADGRITVVQATPSTFRLLLDAGWKGDPALRVLVGGEAVPRELVDDLAGRVGSLWNMYGPTETTIWSAVHRLEKAAPVLIGRPIANTRLHVLDPNRALVPVGVPGELYIGGDGLARGYLDRPELTADRFVADPFGDGRLYRTGDLVRRREDGALEFLGRIDFQVKIRGFRVELGEIEAILAQHAEVREAVVVAREDEPGDKRLVAYVTAAAGATPASAALRAHVKDALPDYMVPSAFVVLERLPLTANNKIDRKALPAPEAGAGEARLHVEPRGPVEGAIAAIFAEVLKAPRVGARDGFFELGGHSLLATAVIARVRSAFGVELPLRALFEAPTPAELAARVDAALREGHAVTLPPIERVARTGEVALSFGQERLWFINQLDPGDPSYVVPLGMRLAGALDLEALARALAEIARRHEVLRTTYALVGGRPVATVHDGWGVDLAVTRWPTLSREAREATLRAEITAEVRRPFDFAASAPIRARLFELADEDHVLLVSLHHVVSDAWSLGILNREIVALYGAFRESEPSPLPELPVQYADYAAWQRRWLEGEALDRQLGYWKQHLAGAPAALELPTDRPRPKVASHRGGRRMLALSPRLTQALRELARREGATLFMTLLAAFDVLLHRWSGQRSVVVGTPIAGRTRAETEPLIGFFVNTLAIRAELDDEQTFTELLARVKEACLGAYAHQDLPFERLVQEIDPARDLGRSPIFQVMFALQNTPGESRAPAGLERRGVTVDSGTSKFDLTLVLVEAASGLTGPLEYAADLFDATTIERMVASFEVLLDGVAAHPERRLWELPILPAEEERRLLVEGTETATEYPRDASIHALFEAQAARTPDAVALVFGDRALSYRELDRQANQLARCLRARGVTPEAPVGLYARRSLEMVIATLAILKAGGAYVPLDPEMLDARLAWTLADAGIALVVAAAASPAGRPLGDVAVLDLAAEAATIAAESAEPPAPIGAGGALAYIMYTSGSTGIPKGVCVVHRGVVRLVKSTGYARFGADEVFLQLASISFDAATLEIWGPLLNGGRLVVFPAEMPSPTRIGGVVRASGVTTMWATVGLFNALIEAGAPGLGQLRQLLFGGEAASVAHVQKALEVLPGVQLINGYGPTENTTFTACYPVAPGLVAGSVPIGRPIANTVVYVLDGHRQLVPVGVAGELYVGGDGLARGYLARPELTAEKFVQSPFSGDPAARLYRTGDQVRWLADGTLAFLGRLDQQVKLRGFRIELGEIEAALGGHPGVGACALLLREDAPGEKRLVAYVVAGDAAPSAAELRSHLKDRLPEYMVPSAFVLLPALPLTANGKIDRRALPAPEAGLLEGEGFVAPRSATEEAIAAIWGEVLGLARVGVHSDFFELGGHSLLATKVMARIAQALRVDLPLRTLFEVTTVAGLSEVADFVSAARPGAVAPADPDVEEGEL